jgi:hypothetical protein
MDETIQPQFRRVDGVRIRARDVVQPGGTVMVLLPPVPNRMFVA